MSWVDNICSAVDLNHYIVYLQLLVADVCLLNL